MTDDAQDPVEETIERLSEVQERHYRAAGPIQRAVRRAASLLGRPGSIALLSTLMCVWIGGNVVARLDGLAPVESAPFSDTALVVTVAAFLTSLLILSAQRFDEELADRRAQLTLQLAVLSERKLAKIIALLEEQRRDNFLLAPREDAEARQLAQPVDLSVSLDHIEAASRRNG